MKASNAVSWFYIVNDADDVLAVFGSALRDMRDEKLKSLQTEFPWARFRTGEVFGHKPSVGEKL